MTDGRLSECFDIGTSIFVGTIDAGGMPACCRAIAVKADAELETATVYVPIATSRDTLANLAATHRLAVVVTKPIEHASIQLKGRSRAARLAREDEEAFVRTRLEGLAAVLSHIGIPPHVTRGFSHWPAMAIDMRVDEIYEQTPGPKAGTRLR